MLDCSCVIFPELSSMTRFSRFLDSELDCMEIAFCNEGLNWLVDEIRMERDYRELQNKEKEPLNIIGNDE